MKRARLEAKETCYHIFKSKINDSRELTVTITCWREKVFLYVKKIKWAMSLPRCFNKSFFCNLKSLISKHFDWEMRNTERKGLSSLFPTASLLEQPNKETTVSNGNM